MAGHRKGFTLIEILMVVVVIGSLTAIAMPHYSASKKKAYAAAMQADLHIVALYEEQLHADNPCQSSSGAATPGSPLPVFTPSPDVTITTTAFNILGSRLWDWTAIARHPKT